MTQSKDYPSLTLEHEKNIEPSHLYKTSNYLVKCSIVLKMFYSYEV